MFNYALLAGVLIATPALAQSTSMPTANPAQPATLGKAGQTMQPATGGPQPTTDTMPAAPGTSGSSASVSTTPSSTTTTTNPADAVASLIAAEWSNYDADSNKHLSRPEFSKWMITLRQQNAAAQKDQVKDVNAWAGAAFGQADADKNGAVTKAELESFLKG